MTEAEWMGSSDPKPMLTLMSSRASGRKLRLFAVALARQFGDSLTDPAYWDAIEVAERASDGAAKSEELAAALKKVDGLIATGPASPAEWYRTATPEVRSLHF